MMTPEERVGQLFLVSFLGTDSSPESHAYDLIVNHHVGGVVLLSSNDNFVAAPETTPAARDLIRRLQQVEWNSSARPPADPTTGRPLSRAYVPLFIATIQEGDGAPGDQILTGLTPLPSVMAIGATWSAELSQKVGDINGRELAQLGFNMYFGPSLDVLENPGLASANDLGAGVFGGDPFWVSMLGSAYVTGLHEGSQGRVLVVPKSFPGRGSSDRLSEQEVATVRKSLDELKQIELAPFFAVTGEDSPGSTADGLLLSHIRYQGFQGNIRATTKPVSFDAQALGSIMTLPEFAAWRDAGGLIISDNLGTKAVRSFYSSGTEFAARNVARDAFVAGNDLLFLGNIISSDAPDNYASVVEILEFFTRKYGEDPGFAQRVDQTVLRLLTAKYKLYGRFALDAVTSTPVGTANASEVPEQVTFEVAGRAATLLSPAPQDLATLLQAPPKPRDRIVFFTDPSIAKQCSTCADQAGLGVEALQRAVVTLYGPESGNQTSSFRLSSYTLEDAQKYAAGESPAYLVEDLAGAAWVVFSLVDNYHGQARAISNFLAQEQELLRDKRVILFAFGAPIYLDATDISRLTAYYALYSKQPAFVDVAARLLFQEITPVGASPVSIPGLGYDLRSETSPDPDQIISLALDLQAVPSAAGEGTPVATAVPLFSIGDTINIRTGTIRDHNGHPVPDGTVVTFSMELRGEGGSILQQEDAITEQGIARVSFGLDKPGLLEIHATSDPAKVSQVLQLDASSAGQPAAVTVIVPQLTPAVEASPGITPSPDENDYVTRSGSLRFSAWVATVLLLMAGGVIIGLAGSRLAGSDWGRRWGMASLAGGLAAYNYIALGLPGGRELAAATGIGGVVLLSAAGLLAGWGAGWIWWRRSEGK